MRGLPDEVVDARRTGGDSGATNGERTVDGTRERVLEAALVVLRDVGYGQFSVQKVAREAGVYQGNITYYWPRRRDLVLALAERIVDDYRQAFVASFHAIDVSVDGWAESVVRAIVDDAISEDRVRLLPELWSMANSDPEIADTVRRGYEDVPVALLDALGISQKHPRRETVRAALALICMAAQGLTPVHGHRGGEDPRIPEMREALVALHAPAIAAALGG